MQVESNYHELIRKLDAFIRKYYKNQLIRGAIYAFTLLLGFYLAVTLLESFAWFSTIVRSLLFWCYVLSTAFVLWKLVLTPIFHLNRIGKIISHEEAAKIVGEHFIDIKDKLINTLQLHNQTQQTNQSINLDLVYASIQQKSTELRPVSFTNAIDLGTNKKYLRYAAIPFVIFIGMLFIAPSLLTDSTTRLLQHNTSFKKPAPFEFNIINKALQATQFDDFTVDVKITGKEIPQEVYVEVGGNTFRLEKQSKLNFNYTFRNIQGDVSFRLLADGFNSNDFVLKAVPNPVIVNFGITLYYPAYLGKKNEIIKNTGDLLIPAGTRVLWNFGTQNTSSVNIRFSDTAYTLAQQEENKYSFNHRFLQSTQYTIRSSNRFMQGKDSMQYSITVISDQVPTIQLDEQRDSASYQRVYFRGLSRDDYGISKLQFKYRFIKKEGEPVNENPITLNIPINHSTQEQFFHYWDLNQIGLKTGDELEYYFEVWDNDGVKGPKSARSQSNVFKTPSLGELAKDAEEKNKALKDDMEAAIKKAKDLQKNLDAIQRDLLNKKSLDFEDKKKINEVLKQQKELEKKMEELKDRNEKNNKQQNELKKEDPTLAEKQKQLQDLFEKLMSPEMKKMMEELEKLMSEVNKEKLQEKMDQMKLDNKDLEKQLERTLELYKQLELEQKMKETADQLEQLSKDQDKLADKADEKNADSDKMKEDQKDLNKQFDDLKKSLDDIEKKNQELEYSQELKDFDKEQESIDEDMQNSEQQLSQKQNTKASKSQKSAAKKMKDLADKINQNQKEEQQEQAEEDMNAMRALLENLLRFSFNQESLMEDLKTVDVNNPKFLKMSQQQRKLKDDAKVLEDSLLALSKRVMKISSTVNEQITDIHANAEKAIGNLQERQVQVARANQQYIMTAVNNLALLLSESLDQQQQQMMQQPSNSACKKPGQGKPKPGPSAGDVKKMQEKLAKQLQEMKGKLENGKKPGEKGEKGKPGGQGGMSEELARMAAQQEALRNAIQQLDKESNKDGKGKLGDLQKIAQQMEETEKDIVNKRINEITMQRQQEILTRLLESEKAEHEREMEEKRESNQGRDITRAPPQFEEYKRLKLKETELLKTIPPNFTTFYKNLVNSYFQSIED